MHKSIYLFGFVLLGLLIIPINASIADAQIQTLPINKINSGLIHIDPLDDQINTKEQLQQDDYWRFGGSAVTFNTPYDYYQNNDGLSIGVQGISGYSGYYSLTPPTYAQLFHSKIITPYQSISNNWFQNGLYVQTYNGLVNYVACVSITSTYGTSWHVIRTLGNLIEATEYEVLWSDNSPNQPLERDCTIITNGDNYLKIILDNVVVYESSILQLQMPGPFLTFLEVQSSLEDDILYGIYRDFYIASDENILIKNLPPETSRIDLVDLQGTVIKSGTPLNGESRINIASYNFPLASKIIVYDENDIELASTPDIVSIFGGDIFSVGDALPTLNPNPVIEINSMNMNGIPINGLWTEIYENNQLVMTGFTPVTFTGKQGSQYLVALGDYQTTTFDHWDDGSKIRVRGITSHDDLILNSFYQNVLPSDTLSPVITLNGDNPLTLELGINTYTENGASVTDNDPTYAGTISIGGDLVNVNAVGTYIVTYNAPADSSGNVPIGISRTVNVIDSKPSAPTGLTATATSTSQINLSWNAPSNNGGSAIAGYKVERQTGSGSWSTIAANAGTSTTYSNTGLTDGTTYTYRVSAINSVGTGSASNTASATTQILQTGGTFDNDKDSLVTGGWTGYVNVIKFTGLTPGSQIDKVALKVANPSGNIRYKVYQDDGANGNPLTLLAQSGSILAQPGTVYNSLTSPAIVPSSGNVWVGFETDSSSLVIHYGTGVKKHIAHPYGNGPSPFGVSVGSNSFEIWTGINIIASTSSSNT